MRAQKHMRAAAALLAAAAVLPLAAQAPVQTSAAAPHVQPGQPAYPAPTNLRVLPKDLTGLQVRELMKTWSGELGVQCSNCHAKDADPAAATASAEARFADDSNPAKATARLMYTMTDQINSKFIATIANSGLPVTCGTCHQGNSSPAPFLLPSPHSSQPTRPLHVADYQTRPCTECHTEFAGPYLYNHAPMQAEGCSGCHAGHGSPNPHLLLKADVDTVCRQCHIPKPDPASGAHIPPSNAQSPTQPCTACHTEVHGSSRSSLFLKLD